MHAEIAEMVSFFAVCLALAAAPPLAAATSPAPLGGRLSAVTSRFDSSYFALSVLTFQNPMSFLLNIVPTPASPALIELPTSPAHTCLPPPSCAATNSSASYCATAIHAAVPLFFSASTTNGTTIALSSPLPQTERSGRHSPQYSDFHHQPLSQSSTHKHIRPHLSPENTSTLPSG